MTRRARMTAIAAVVGATVIAVASSSSAATARGGPNEFREQLTGYQETPLALSTSGSGQIRIHIDERQETISYRLSYRDLEGNVTQAHIHFGARAQTGGVVAFLCSNLDGRPEGTQPCPDAPATITGTITPDDIRETEQGIAAGEFDEVVDAIRAGAGYANVHSDLRPVGEIRGQFEHRH